MCSHGILQSGVEGFELNTVFCVSGGRSGRVLLTPAPDGQHGKQKERTHMKKRLLALFLALVLTVGLTIPAFAADSAAEEHLKTIILTHTIDGHSFESFDGIDAAYSWKLSYWDFDSNYERVIVEDYNGYCAVRQGTIFTATNAAPASQNNFVRVYLSFYEKNSDGTYWDNQYPHSAYLTRSGEFLNDVMRPDDYGGLVELKPGESFQFKLPEFASDAIYKIELRKWDMDNATTVTDEWGNTYEEAPTYSKWTMFKVDNAAVDSYLAGGTPSNPSNPSNTSNPTIPPEQPTTQLTNADSFPYSIPGTPDFLRFSVQPIGSYQTDVYDSDIGGDKAVMVYHFPVGAKLGLTAEGINKGYSIANVSSGNLDDLDRTEFTLTKGTRNDQWFMVSSPDDPEGFIAYVHPINTNTTFQDVKAGAYYEDAVKWAVKYGITNGTSNTAFTPERTCSNAEILTMVYRAFEWMPVLENNPFTDVKQSDYYYDAARWAAEYDIVSGATFDPDKPCTRAMAMTYIWKALMSPDAGSSTNFTDVPVGADYAKAVAWAVGMGITNGTSSTTFSPNDTCTRGQIATFLYRALGE